MYIQCTLYNYIVCGVCVCACFMYQYRGEGNTYVHRQVHCIIHTARKIDKNHQHPPYMYMYMNIRVHVHCTYMYMYMYVQCTCTWWSREKQAEVLSTGSMTTMTRSDSLDTLIFFIHTDTGNSTPYDVTASNYMYIYTKNDKVALTCTFVIQTLYMYTMYMYMYIHYQQHVSLLERCPHFRGCYVGFKVET